MLDYFDYTIFHRLRNNLDTKDMLDDPQKSTSAGKGYSYGVQQGALLGDIVDV